MSSNDIDDFFREKFKEFEEMPDEKVWEAIANSLDKKRNRKRIVPFWWKIGAAAAVLLFSFYLLNPFGQEQEGDGDNAITKDNKESPLKENDLKDANKDVEQKTFEIPQNASNAVVTTKTESLQKNDQNSGTKNVKGFKTNSISSNENSVNAAISSEISSDFSKVSDTLQLAQNKQDNKDNIQSNEVFDQSIAHQQKDKQMDAKLTQAQDNPMNKNDQNNMASNTIRRDSTLTVQEGLADQTGKKSIFDEIDKQEKEKEEEVALAENQVRWSVGPSVAPVYFNAVGEGSSIHSNFVANAKTGKTNLSYGLTVSYELSKKLSVRSGVHKVDYGYNTNDVAITAVADANTNPLIENINYDLASRNLSISSKKVTNNNPAAASDVVNASAVSPTRNARMEQDFGYIEVPLELTYALLDRKFGINLIGGVSSLFLTENAINLESGDLQTEVGTANNINSVNLSTNIGLGVQYKFTPKIQFRVEPIFKYQWNTFSETFGNFNPFSVGVYTGINYKF